MNMNDLKGRFTELKDQIAELQRQFKTQAAMLFAAESKQVFEQFPTLRSFRWTQYTPYWCDGDTCEFGVHMDYDLTITMEKDGQEERFDEMSPSSTKRQIESGTTWDDKPFVPGAEHWATVAIGDFTKQFDDSLMKELFGDHVEVTVFHTGQVQIGEHEHD
jgi:hypothetical protein